MANQLKWGLIGTGKIARRFAAGLLESRKGELVAVGSRSATTAAAFTGSFGGTPHESYESLLADPSVEAVYLSTPHTLHQEWAIKTLEAGKHLLCEKPLTVNHAGTQRVIDAARRNGRFLMEAFMYRVHPQMERLIALLESRPIGEIRFIRATFSYDMPLDLTNRAYRHDLAGGGILDVGCYPISITRRIAGVLAGKAFEEPIELSAVGQIGAESRVDEYSLASLKFPGGILAEVAAGTRLGLENNVRIVGSEGSILIPTPWQPAPAGGFSKILLFKEGIPEEIVVDADRSLYAYEADHVADQIAAGRHESPLMSWEDSLGNARVLDQWRAAIGLRYDFEGLPS